MRASINRLRYFTDFNDQSEQEETTEFVIPEDVSELSDNELRELHAEAIASFQSIYGDGSNLTDADVDALAALTDGIEGLNAEIQQREAHAAERAARAAELASKVVPAEEDSGEEDEDEAEVVEEEDEDDEDEDGEQEQEEAETETETIVASNRRREVRVAVSRKNAAHLSRQSKPKGMKDVAYASDSVAGYSAGQGVDWNDLGRIVDNRLGSYSHAQFEAAARSGKTMRQQLSVATFRKPMDESLTINGTDRQHIDDVINRAIDESRLPGGSLVAAGGWCAPSETIYDLVELESRDGLFDLPEVGVARGGINRTLGPTFSEIYAAAQGFSYTEEQDIDGTYGVDEDGIGDGSEGSKPCYTIECPEFEEFRLGVDGICIQAGLLMARGYPEVIARTMRGVLTAHEHKMSGRRIQRVEAGSTPVAMPTPQAGALTPLLSSIEMQVEHYKYTHRLARGTTLEAVFPYWVRAVIRADLARRQGVEMIDVPDSRIDAWFRSRGVNPQFVYNWQDLTGTADSMTAWPTEVKFLLYVAGTWIRGSSDVLTLDTLYDSTLIGNNDYTALFTEEGWMVVKMSHDSRVVTVPICADGTTSAGVLFDCDGSVMEQSVSITGPVEMVSETP